ncbi:MAG: class I SAM-dependent methyltransferase [Desulfobulbaceae bacterium]|jgi:predicted O-methyltransferase YrrM|nr:class I SAM-dependent methyltransferase [Desulfobulbaceae bacterium]
MESEDTQRQSGLAADEHTVSTLYQNAIVADKYIQARFVLAWQQLLHQTQTHSLRQALQVFNPGSILEIAPGPARLSTELTDIQNGVMLEYSQEMIDVARDRLKERNLLDRWSIIHGNAFDVKDCPGPFDLIYTFRFIRHFDKDDRTRLYTAIRSRLNPCGILVFDVVNSAYNMQDKPSSAAKQSDALSVFDVGYTVKEFQAEMNIAGFEVLDMRPVARHFRIQALISSKLYDVAPNLARRIVRVIETIPSRSPLEWIAVCRKMDGRE